jgi:hypothetical protein
MESQHPLRARLELESLDGRITPAALPFPAIPLQPDLLPAPRAAAAPANYEPPVIRFRTSFPGPSVTPAPVGAPAAGFPRTYTPVLDLAAGRGSGTLTQTPGEEGTRFKLTGKVRLDGIGRFSLSGSIRETAEGRLRGRLVLTSAAGTIVIDVRGPKPADDTSGDQPRQLRLVVARGTGLYGNTTGNAAARVTLTPGDGGTGTFGLRFS